MKSDHDQGKPKLIFPFFKLQGNASGRDKEGIL